MRPRCGAAPACRGRRRDRQRRLDRLAPRLPDGGGVHGHEVGDPRAHAGDGDRLRARQHSRQLLLPGRDRHADGAEVLRAGGGQGAWCSSLLIGLAPDPPARAGPRRSRSSSASSPPTTPRSSPAPRTWSTAARSLAWRGSSHCIAPRPRHRQGGSKMLLEGQGRDRHRRGPGDRRGDGEADGRGGREGRRLGPERGDGQRGRRRDPRGRRRGDVRALRRHEPRRSSRRSSRPRRTTYGRLDVLHNNAGVHETNFTMQAASHELPDEVWDKVIAINLRGPWLLLEDRGAAPRPSRAAA